jgi:hypothetical protein
MFAYYDSDADIAWLRPGSPMTLDGARKAVELEGPRQYAGPDRWEKT